MGRQFGPASPLLPSTLTHPFPPSSPPFPPGGNQREIDRNRAQARNAKNNPKGNEDGLTPAQRNERCGRGRGGEGREGHSSDLSYEKFVYRRRATATGTVLSNYIGC